MKKCSIYSIKLDDLSSKKSITFKQLTMKWYEELQRQCHNCKEYLAEEIKMKIETKNNRYIIWKCKFCNYERKKVMAFAIYKHESGKTFLKRNGWKDFREVELRKIRGELKVIPTPSNMNML